MSQEQQDQGQQVGAEFIAPSVEEKVEGAAPTDAMNQASTPSQRRRPKKKTAVVSEEALVAMSAHSSYWPLALALALVVLLVGAITNTVIFIIGVVLVAAAIIAWGMERR